MDPACWNAGWISSLPIPELLTRASDKEKTGRESLLNRRSCRPDDPLGQWSELKSFFGRGFPLTRYNARGNIFSLRSEQPLTVSWGRGVEGGYLCPTNHTSGLTTKTIDIDKNSNNHNNGDLYSALTTMSTTTTTTTTPKKKERKTFWFYHYCK